MTSFKMYPEENAMLSSLPSSSFPWNTAIPATRPMNLK